MKLIKLDITTYLYIILFFLCGNYKKILLILFITIAHEMGHYILFKIYNIKVLSIKIYPFGGIITTNKLLNFNPNKELIISLGGISIQLLLYIIFYILLNINLINNYTYNLFIKLNTSLIIFNLLPIYPLDGHIILNSILNKFTSFNKAYNITIISSFIFLIIFIIYNKFKINNIIIINFIIYKLYTLILNLKYIKNKFLLERCIYELPYDKIVYNKKFNKDLFMINKLHYFNFINEKKYLNNYFHSYKD